MAPLLYLVRHAEGQHNVNHAVHIKDATLTEEGKRQCRELQDSFAYHDTINLVLSSPLRRAIQTTVLTFGPTLSRKEVPYLVIPKAQEVSGLTCDIGHSKQELSENLSELFAGNSLQFDLSKINFDAVEEGWNVKSGYWAPCKSKITQRAADLRSWLFRRSEAHILLVTHGAFLHYLTEDWAGDDPVRGTAYLNCEVRVFEFTPMSTAQDAHIVETPRSRKSRGASLSEHDPHVLSELISLEA
ncbi:phosphoglycerate mutase-like protein [Lindgomyces ingoldianus]|uniref:Phosphoglycerate mutase-like protein n=1 Tax=Lindgomyces ingoldianus TaxID=673940 RepID=A0ACB6QKF4_9PLEO|nr:phosphoglycerate mutase-like protein [Lindgomyces ingoldianus]KAF2466626.1 phosphoglycerate mutase-like protein [Lindgomyces ingoldianus]